MTTHNGDIFGGYMDTVYNPSINGYQSDPKAFLFSLTKNEKYPIMNSDKAHYYDQGSDNGILLFGQDDLVLKGGCNGNTVNFGDDYKLPADKDFSVFGYDSQTYLTSEETWIFTA
jgi:TLD